MSHPNLAEFVDRVVRGDPQARAAFAAAMGRIIRNRALKFGYPALEAVRLAERGVMEICVLLGTGVHLTSGQPLKVWFQVQVRTLLFQYWAHEQFNDGRLDRALRIHALIEDVLAPFSPWERRLLALNPAGAVDYELVARALALTAPGVRSRHQEMLRQIRRQLAASLEAKSLLARLGDTRPMPAGASANRGLSSRKDPGRVGSLAET